MKLSCHVIRDLLPLYHDDVCSRDSRMLVDEHLEGCVECAGLLRELRGEIEIEHEEPDDAAALTKLGEIVQRRGKRAWLGGMAAVLVLVLLVMWLNVCLDRRYQARYAPFFADQDPIRTAGVLETTEIYEAMFEWIHGNYRFRVNVPRPGCQGMIEVEEFQRTKDIRDQNPVKLSLTVRFAEGDSCLYDIVIESTDPEGLWRWEKLTLDQNGQTVDDARWDAEALAWNDQILETYRSRILDLLMAVEREWPFLAER